MPFTIVRQDITKMKVDAIVNAANTRLLMGGGVCGAIFRAAGIEKLQDACNKLAPIKTGGAAITPGFSLPAKYIVHAAGPVYSGKDAEQCERLLRSAYTKSLKLAMGKGCESIAFPLISSGIFGYPKAEALEVATSAITSFLSEYDMNIYLAVFDKTAFVVSEHLIGEVESYIDENYIAYNDYGSRTLLKVEEEMLKEVASPSAGTASLQNMINHLDEPFSATLLKLIDKKGMTDVEVYKKANIDRKLFSKIRTVKGYTPKKPTILALAIALKLTLEETEDLLARAGYALSPSYIADVIVEYFIVKRRYNIYEINECLFKYDQPLLGG